MPEPRDTPRSEGLSPVVASLRALRSRARATLITQRVMLVLVLLALGGASLILLDYLLRFPSWIRSFHLVVGIGATFFLLFRLAYPALRFRPSLTSLALRLERENPRLRGLLASAVEFERGATAPESPTAAALETAVIARAAHEFRGVRAASILRRHALYRRGAQLTALALAFAAAGMWRPDLARVGAMRLIAPWSSAQWPKRTGIVDSTSVAVHPRGAALALRAAVTRSHKDLDTTYAAAQYRLLNAEGRTTTPLRTALLTHQRREIALPEGESGSLFERLIEADAATVEYRFVTDDDATEWKRIRVVDPPMVASAKAKITPPEYASALAATGSPLASIAETEMGPGVDERATAAPALAGSTVELTLTLNKPIPARPEDPEWVRRTFGAALADEQPSLVADGAKWTLRWTLERSVRAPIALLDEHDIPSADEASYRFEALADREPSVAITDPPADLSLLPGATLNVTGEGRDEVALSAVWVEQQVARPLGARTPSGPGGAVEPIADPSEIVRVDAGAQRAARATVTLSLADLQVRPGDEVWLTAVATDALGASIPLGEAGARGPTRSATRKLRIISEAELIEEIRAELNAVRQTAIRIDAQQGEVMDQTAARGSDRRTRAGQSQIGERLTRQREALARLAERAERNGLSDARLGAMLESASGATGRAGEASQGASQTLEQAAAKAKESDEKEANEQGEQEDSRDAAAPLDEAQAAQTAEEQRRVRDELATMIEALDAGQDGWVARRQIERLLREQNENREATRAAGAATAGLPSEALSPEQREALERVAEKQEELADQARKLAEDLPQRAEQVRKQDPAAAAGMEQAARSARNNQIAQKMDQAAQQARQNQTGDSTRSQQQAAQTLQQMLEELDKGERSRQEQLRRQLASLIASIEALVAAQTHELDRLDAALAPEAPQPPALAGLDVPMIALNRNTAGTLDSAQGAGREVAPIARLLSRAVEAQGVAIGALRAAQGPAARQGEADSLARLREALIQARTLDEQQEQAQQDQQRAEIRRAYAALLERQITVRDQSAAFAGVEQPSRRDRAAIRALGEEQVSIREALATMARDSKELSDASVFEFAHRRLDTATGAAGDALRAGNIPPALPQQERAVKGLRDILASLADSSPKKKDFNEGQAGGDSGGAGMPGGKQALIPPLAQLRLLRAIQGDVAQDTRLAADTAAPPEAIERIASDQKELANRAAALLDQLLNEAKPKPVLPEPGEAPAPPVNPDDLRPAPEPDPDAPPAPDDEKPHDPEARR